MAIHPGPVVTTFEPIEGVRATLTAKLSADSMHELLLGTLPLGKALLFRKLKVSGSKSKAMVGGVKPTS